MALAASSREDLYLVVASAGPIDEREWRDWLAMLARGRGQRMRLLVETHGGAPDVIQRKQFIELYRSLELRAAVLTDSALARGVVTALAWVGVSLQAFPLGSVARACRYLELGSEQAEWLDQELARLRGTCLVRPTA